MDIFFPFLLLDYKVSIKLDLRLDYSKWWKNLFFIFNINLTIIQNGGQSIVKPVFNVYQTSFEIGTCLCQLYLSTHLKSVDKDGPFD